ncbi:MAG TPA: endonuclease [Bacteriovoracaceae bacterium]|nr:endonuclease [Bacteriovoracaceae bacterium]
MKIAIVLINLLISVKAFASVHQRVGPDSWAYYGKDFYQRISGQQKLFKDQVGAILNLVHTSTAGAFDTITATCSGNCYRHTSVGYEGARKIIFGETFIKRDQAGIFVTDVYCGKKFYYRALSEVSAMHTEVNIEHTWPQSKFSHAFNKDIQKSDMHHLFPTDSDANNRRGNFHFGYIEESRNELEVENCSISRLGDESGHSVFTPPVAHRGNVARALFYFSTRYNLEIPKGEESILRQWHTADPVDVEEVTRHEIIARYQQVRNPFVDHPALAERISDF